MFNFMYLLYGILSLHYGVTNACSNIDERQVAPLQMSNVILFLTKMLNYVVLLLCCLKNIPGDYLLEMIIK